MRRDILTLERAQRAEIFSVGGKLRRAVDHPLNAPLLGLGSPLERAADLAVEAGDRTVVIYASCAGVDRRCATAAVRSRSDGALVLADWRIENGFARRTGVVGDGTAHRIVARPGQTPGSVAAKLGR